VAELDEMWHFIGSKKISGGYGKLLIVMEVDLSTGSVATVMAKP
jgi:hypothetical protein